MDNKKTTVYFFRGALAAVVPMAIGGLGNHGGTRQQQSGRETPIAIPAVTIEMKPPRAPAPSLIEGKPSAATQTAFYQSAEIKPVKQPERTAERDDQVFEKLIEHLYARENCKLTVYQIKIRDGKGGWKLDKPTVGVGHVVLACDGLSVGDRITEQQAKDFLARDARKAFDAARQQAKEAGIDDPDFIAALGSVNFQLGTGWHKTFKQTWQLIKSGQYETAAARLEHTKWNDQTPNRVQDFQEALRALPARDVTYKISAGMSDEFLNAMSGKVTKPQNARPYALNTAETNGAAVLTPAA